MLRHCEAARLQEQDQLADRQGVIGVGTGGEDQPPVEPQDPRQAEDGRRLAGVEKGKRSVVEIHTAEAYLRELNRKLGEELAEYQSSGDVAELADMAEVILALAQAKGLSVAAFEALRRQKVAERGAFENRLFLVAVDDSPVE